MASNNIARLGVVLALDSAQFKADIDQAIAANQKLKQAIQRDSNAAAGAIIELKHATEDYGKTLTKVEQIQREITSGRYMNATQDMKTRLLQQAAAYDRVVASQAKFNKGLTDQQKMQVSYQMTDLVTQIASGQNAMIALMQQGGQLKDAFGGIGNMFRALASMFNPVIAGFAAVGGAIAGMAGAFVMGRMESNQFRNDLILTNNFAGLLGKDVDALSNSVSSKLNVSIGEARASLYELAKSGKFSDDSITSVNEAVLRFAKLSGIDAKEAAKQLGAMIDGTASSAKAMNDKFHFLTLAQYKYIEALERSGDKQKAMKATADAFNESMKTQTSDLGLLEKSWNLITQAISRAWDALKGFGRESLSQRRDELVKNIASSEEKLAESPVDSQLYKTESIRIARMKSQLADVDKQIADADARAQAAAKETKAIADYEATGGMKGYLQRANELWKQQFQNRIQARMEFAGEEEKLELEAISKIEISKAAIALKNQEEGNRLFAYNKQWQAEYELGILTKLTQDVNRLRRESKEKQILGMSEEAEQQKALIDEINARQGKASKAFADSVRDEEYALDIERQRVQAKQDFLFASEADQRIAQSRLDLAVRIRQIEQSGEYAAKDKPGMIERLKDLQNVKEGLIAFEESIARVNAKWDSVFNNMANALDNFVRTGKLSFKDLARSIIADLISIEMRAQGKLLFGLLKNAILGAGGYTDAQNKIVGEVGLPMKRASGGTISAGSPYMVGERGPELFVPSQSGTIIPNNNLSSMSGGGQVINNYNISAIDVKSFEERILGSSRAIWAANAYANKSLAVAQGRA